MKRKESDKGIPDLLQKDKVVIVTGSRRGLGKAMALAFAQAGADLVISDVVTGDGLLESTARDIKELGRRVYIYASRCYQEKPNRGNGR